MMEKNILVYVELDNENNIVPVSLELIHKSVSLTKEIENTKVFAFFITNQEKNDEILNTLKKSGVDKIYLYQNSELKYYSTEYYSQILLNLLNRINPNIILIGATTQGRDLAPKISTALKTGLTADCTALNINEKGLLAATRPTFGGKMMATILCKTKPQMATVRPSVLEKNPLNYEKIVDIEKIEYDINQINTKIKLLELIKLKKQSNNIEAAQIILAGGKGLKTKENFLKLEKLAKKLNASIAATRAAVESGFASADIQVGQTGKTVKPKLYIAFAISGAIQHTIGMEESDIVVAINTDKNAPIFKYADYGICTDAISLINEWLEDN